MGIVMSGSPMAGRSEWGRRFARLYQQAGSPTVTEIVSTTRLTNIETIRGWLPGPNNPDPRVPRSWSESLEVVLQDLADRAARAAEREGRSFGRQPMANWRRWREKAAAEQKARDARTTSPFRGLASYGPEHAEEFFGREDLAQDLAQRISAGFAGSGPRLVVVVGVSGSGKSSLVGAGLAPLISEGVKVEVFTPGSNPLEALSDAVRHLAGSEAGQVLVADQCEEVWTLHGTEPVEDAEPDSSGRPVVAPAFFEQLQSVADRPETVIVVVIRADFYGSALNHEFLAAGLGAPVNVGAMTREQVRRAIVGPAALCGVTADEDLVELILTELAVSGGDGAHDPGALPHLSHALQEAWKERAPGGKRLTVAHYRKSRGISGSIAKLANSVYESLDSDGQRAIERVLIRSVTGEKIWARRPVARRELEWTDIPPHVVDAVVDKFIHERLLTADQSGIQITHEALLRSWPLLRKWIADSHEDRAVRHRYAVDALHWEAEGKKIDGLLSAGRTEDFAKWASEQHDELSILEREFLDASVTHHGELAEFEARRLQREKQRSERLRKAVVALTLVGAVMVGTAVFAVRAEQDQTAQYRISHAHEQAATSYTVRSGAPEVGGLLAANAERGYSDFQTRSALLSTQDDMFAGRIPGNGSPNVELAFDRAGVRMVVAAQDGTNTKITLYDTATWTPRVSTSVVGKPYAVSLDSTGRRIAVNAGRRISVFDVETGQWTVLPGSFNDGAATLRYNPVTAVLATVDAAGMPALWDAEGLNPLPLPAGTITKVQSVAFSRDGQTMALADSGIVQIHRGGKPSRTIRESVNELRAIALDQHGRRLVLADHNGTVRWWDLDTGDETGRFVALDTAARSIDFGADNLVIALTQENHSVRLLDTATDDNSLAVLVGHTDMVTSLAFSPDYSTLATTGVDGTIALWRIDPTLMRHHRWADATALAYTVDGTILAAAARDGTVTTYDTATGEPVNSAPGCAEASTGTADAVAVSTDARYAVLSCNGRPGHVRISDLTNHRNLGVDIPVARFPPALALSPDNTLLATGNYLNHLELWGLGTRAVLPTSPTVSIPIASTIRALAFSPDGKYLAYAADNGTVAVYPAADLRPGVDKPAAQVLSVLNTSGTSDRRPGSAGFTYRTITFSADSAGIAVSGDDGSIRIWQRTSTGFEPALILTSRPANVHALAFSTDPNSPAIVTANREGSRRRWTLDTDDVTHDVCTAATGAIDELTDLGSLLDDWKC
ncbi:AAA family ATPase [Nocardia wallacei]|uniref:nSTAND1 domain-containing NTPase n=1 Tax=Nocardia wallacei TaxID=480035 RepID=UPI0024572036|nr:AAA family ATPase [Nocardia wallacei]